MSATTGSGVTVAAESSEAAVLVGVSRGRGGRAVAESSLDELAALAHSAGARVVARLLQERTRLDPATLVGRGKLDQIVEACNASGADVVLFDDELSPAQLRNVERAVERKVLDRTQLILDIFAGRARTREGRLQVELAQLSYLLPRLTGRGALLSRLGGGIGTRGPGETKLETDRRRINRRIQALRREIDRVRRERSTRRDARRRRGQPLVALVGYTNAGKSTLFNNLTRASAEVSDRLFMTLDPLVRRVELGAGREILLIDTVGFIQKLPHGLVAAFRATLEEVVAADLLVHVMDASAEDLDRREAAVAGVLQEIGAGERPCLLVLNKRDRLSPARAARLEQARPEALCLSARTGAGLDELGRVLGERLELQQRRVRLRFGADDQRGIAGVYAAGRVVSHEVEQGEVTLVAELPARELPRFQHRVIA